MVVRNGEAMKIPLHWAAIGLVVFTGFVWFGGYYDGSRAVMKEWKAEVAAASATAAAKKAELDEAARAKESADAEHAMNLEATHAKDLEAVRAGSAAFIDKLNGRLRGAEARCVGGIVPSAAANSGLPEGRAGEPEGGYRGPDPASADRLREVGLTLQTELRDCRAWVLKHGR